MRTLVSLVVVGAVAVASAQKGSSGLPMRMRMSGDSISKAMSAMKSGKSVTITVDNRSVDYKARVVGNMVYVPIRLFQETGQRVTWNPSDMRGTIHMDNGPYKNVLDFDASRGQENYEPGTSMRPIYDKGRLWVPLASALNPFGLMAQWVPSSSRINIKTSS